MKHTLYLLLSLPLILASCCKEVIDDPSGFGYTPSSFTVSFYDTDQTGVPSIDWNGSLGTFGLAASYDGVSVNSANGQLSWNGDLPLGITEISVVATNANASETTTVTLDHAFSGFFSGGYNFDINSTTVAVTDWSVSFNTDGTIDVSDVGTPGSGTWEMNGSTITGVYQYDGVGTDVFIEGTLTYDDATSPYITGLWGNDANNLTGGYFRVDL